MSLNQEVEISLSSPDGADLSKINIISNNPGFVSATKKAETNNVWIIKALKSTFEYVMDPIKLNFENEIINTKVNFTWGDENNVPFISISTID